jgi:anti-sigma factor RsiW
MKVKSSRRLVKRLGLALAVAALVVPNAQALPMSTAGEQGAVVESRQYADDIRVGPVVRKYADDRPVSVIGTHDGYMPINESAQLPVSSSEGSSSSTDWNLSIGIGTLLMVFGLGALVFAVRHTKRGRLAAA